MDPSTVPEAPWLRFYIDASANNPITRVEWQFKDCDAQSLGPLEADKPQHNVRALAIALLCVACQSEGGDQLLKTESHLLVELVEKEFQTGELPIPAWSLTSKGSKKGTWLNTIIFALEDRKHLPPKPKPNGKSTKKKSPDQPGEMLQKLFGHWLSGYAQVLNCDPSIIWRASRDRSVVCLPQPRTAPFVTDQNCPRLEFQLRGKTAFSVITDPKELLQLAKDLEAGNSKQWTHKIFERPTVCRPELPPLSDSLHPYFNALQDDMRGHRYPGPPSSSRNSVPLLQVYQHLHAAVYHSSEDRSQQKTPQDPPSILKSIATEPRLVLLGDPGSGKSTALRHLCLSLAGNRLNPSGKLDPKIPRLWEMDWDATALGRTPVFIELRKLTEFVPPLDTQESWKRDADVSEVHHAQTNDEKHKTWLEQATDEWFKSEVLRQIELFLKRYQRTRTPDVTRDSIDDQMRNGLVLLLLDGWDEVTQPLARKFIQKAFLAFSTLPAFQHCPIVITCRRGVWDPPKEAPPGIPWNFVEDRSSTPPATVPAWRVFSVLPFGSADIQRFLEAWFRVTAGTNSDPIAAARAVWRHLRSDPRGELLELAKTPLLLNMLAWLEVDARNRPQRDRGMGLGTTRAGLYRALSHKLLWEIDSRKNKNHAPSEQIILPDLVSKVQGGRPGFEKMVAFLAWKATDSGDGKVPNDLLHAQIEALYIQPTLPDDNWVRQVEDTLTLRTGLLRLDGADSRTFMHATLREFWAARHLLASLQEKDNDFKKAAADPGKWREPIRFAAGLVVLEQIDNERSDSANSQRFSRAGESRNSHFHLAAALVPLCWLLEKWLESGSSEPGLALLAAELFGIMKKSGLDQLNSWKVRGLRLFEETRSAAICHITSLNDPVRDRSRAGSILGYMGDEREGVGVDPISRLPKLKWLKIPRGPFILGEPGDYPDGQQVPCELPHDFEIAAYPVTVAQYQEFIADGGYVDDGTEEDTGRLEKWWGKSGLEWKRTHQIDGPERYNDTFQVPNSPQIGLCFYEAQAFCRWLTEKTGKINPSEGLFKISLPSEAEWERAARHTDGRVYPWKEGKPSDSMKRLGEYCNCNGSGIGTTSAVGIFPQGKAECGAHDMAGNVWEWTRSLWGRQWAEPDFVYPYDFFREREDLEAGPDISRVLRGGSWLDVRPAGLRCSNRYVSYPYRRGSYIGFRCVRVVCGVGPGRWRHKRSARCRAGSSSARPVPRGHLTAGTKPRADPGENTRSLPCRSLACWPHAKASPFAVFDFFRGLLPGFWVPPRGGSNTAAASWPHGEIFVASPLPFFPGINSAVKPTPSACAAGMAAAKPAGPFPSLGTPGTIHRRCPAQWPVSTHVDNPTGR